MIHRSLTALLLTLGLTACGESHRLRADAALDASTPIDATFEQDAGSDADDAGPAVPRFMIDAPSNALGLEAGGSAQLVVTVARDVGFDDFVAVAISGLPPGVTADANSIVVPSGSTVATFTIEASVGAATSTPVSFTITAMGGGASRTIDRALEVAAPADFVVTLEHEGIVFPTLMNELSLAVRVGRNSAFTAPVTFSAIDLPSAIAMSPLTLQPSESEGVLVFTHDPIATSVEGTFTLRASGGGIDHDFVVAFSVPPALDYALEVGSASLSVARGSSNLVTVTLVPNPSFFGTVTVTASGLPPGVTAEPIELQQGGPLSVDLVIAADEGATLGGPSTITLTGTHFITGAARTTTFDVTVTDAPGFTMIVAPTTVYPHQGGTTDVSVDIVRQGGFDAALSLDLSGGPAGVSGTSTGIGMGGLAGAVAISAALDAALLVPTGASVRATDGSVTRLVPITVVATPPVDTHIDASFGLLGGQRVAADSGYLCGRVLASGVGVAGAGSGVARLSNDGTLDGTWAVGGRRAIAAAAIARRCAVDADGNVVVPFDNASLAESVAFVVKVLGSGAIDTAFGVNGTATVDFEGDYDSVLAPVFRPDGSIYLVGSREVEGNVDLVVARLTTTGALDTTFAGDGMVEFDLGGSESPIGVFAANGGVVIVGRQDGVDGSHIVAIRMTGAGVLDPTFSGDGIQIVDPPGFNHPTAMLELPNGRFLVSLNGNDGTQSALGLVRFDANGSLDTGFDADGLAFVPELASLRVEAMVREGTNRYFVAGSYVRPVGTVNVPVLGVAAVTTAGAVDTTFSDDGVLTIDDGVPAVAGPSVAALDLDPVTGRVWAFGNLGFTGAVFRFVP